MRFCIVTPFFPSTEKSGGGVGTHYYDLTIALAPFCEEIIILFASGEPMDKSIERSLPSNVCVKHVKDDFGSIPGNPFSLCTKIRKRASRLILNIRIAFEILAIDRKRKLDVLETTNYFYLCLFYTFLPNCKPLITRFSSSTGQLRLYGNWQSSRVDLIEQLEIWMFKRSDIKLTHTFQHRNVIAGNMQIQPREIKIIPHGTNIGKGQSIEIEEQGDRPTTILFLGRLESRKGIQTLLGCIPSLLEKYPKLHFRIAGEDEGGVYESKFQKENPDHAPQVKFLGEISHEQKIQEYKRCDIFAAPSLYESFGLIYVEAMSFGKPVIGCRAGGATEVIKEGEVGFLIEPGSVEDLIHCLDILIENQALRIQMGRSAKQRVETYFTADIMAKNSYKALTRIKADWRYSC